MKIVRDVFRAKALPLWLMLCAGVAMGGCTGGEARADEPSSSERSSAPRPTVEVRSAEAGELVLYAAFTGEVVADRMVEVAALESGQLVELLVDEGSIVEQGEVIGRLDDDLQRRRRSETDAAARSATAQLEQAQAELSRLEREIARTERLADRRAVAPNVLEELSDQRMIATSGVSVAEARIDEARAAAASRRVDVTRREIRAPTSGKIVHRHVQQGAQVTAQTPIVTIVDESSLEFVAFISEKRISTLETGRRAQVRMDAAPRDRLEATVRRIGDIVETESRTVEVRFELERTSFPIRHGMFGRGRLALERIEEAIIVPEVALEERTGGTWRIWRVIDEKVEPTEVEVELIADEQAAVRGIDAGDVVVVSPTTRLQAGTEVRTREARDRAARAGGF